MHEKLARWSSCASQVCGLAFQRAPLPRIAELYAHAIAPFAVTAAKGGKAPVDAGAPPPAAPPAPDVPAYFQPAPPVSQTEQRGCALQHGTQHGQPARGSSVGNTSGPAEALVRSCSARPLTAVARAAPASPARQNVPQFLWAHPPSPPPSPPSSSLQPPVGEPQVYQAVPQYAAPPPGAALPGGFWSNIPPWVYIGVGAYAAACTFPAAWLAPAYSV